MIKKYKITFKVNEKGKLKVKRVNHGFNAFELLGLLHRAIREVNLMIDGKVRPDIVKTKVIQDVKKNEAN